jgi:hypothetical protein
LDQQRFIRMRVGKTTSGRTWFIAKVGRCDWFGRLGLVKLRRLFSRRTKDLMPQADGGRLLRRLFARSRGLRFRPFEFRFWPVIRFWLPLANLVALGIPLASSVPLTFVVASRVIAAAATWTASSAPLAVFLGAITLFTARRPLTLFSSTT